MVLTKNAHALSLYHHHVCDWRLTVYSVSIYLCTIFHMPVAIHEPQTESSKTVFFTRSPCFLFYVLQIIYLQKCVFAITAHTISGPYTLHVFNVPSTSEIHIPNIFSPMVLENTKYGVGVSSNDTRVTECIVDTGRLFARLKCSRFRHTGQRADVSGEVAVCAASCHVSCTRAF